MRERWQYFLLGIYIAKAEICADGLFIREAFELIMFPVSISLATTRLRHPRFDSIHLLVVFSCLSYDNLVSDIVRQ